MFHVGAMCVCLLLLPNTRSDLPKGLLYGADLQELEQKINAFDSF
jgi:hypothetical protein